MNAAPPPLPRLLSFDVFGTVVNWFSGLQRDLVPVGVAMDGLLFDEIIDAQGIDEQTAFRPYAEIVVRSLASVLPFPVESFGAIGQGVGRWPVYGDSPAALARMARVAPLAALTNSDLVHREGVVDQLETAPAYWLCAEEVGAYKPDRRMWDALAARVAPAGITPGRTWWHVSAYADYDLAAARAFGLTCVFVDRPHARRGDPALADVVVPDLAALADRVEALARAGAR